MCGGALTASSPGAALHPAGTEGSGPGAGRCSSAVWPATRGPWTCWLLLGLDALPFPWALFSGCPDPPPFLVQGERALSPRERG